MNCDHCGVLLHNSSMTHTDAPYKSFCSPECFYAWQVEKLKAYQPPEFSNPHAYEDAKPRKYQPVNQMSLF